MSTKTTNFINTIAPIAQKLQKSRTKWVLPSVCIAQAALESGWGTSSLMVKANAYFGIKWTKGCGFDAYSSKTQECYDGSTYVTITDAFRAYDCLEDSVEDYFNLICNNSRYAGAVNNADAESAITAIKNGGYATDPSYISKIMSIVKTYGLTKYDSANTSYYAKYTGSTVSIVTALQALCIDSSFSFRQKIAVANGISAYKGTASQNTAMLNLLKQGKLIKP